MKKYTLYFFLPALLLCLFLCPEASLEGAKNGLLLWFQTVLPTLLPFLILTSLMIQLHISTFLSNLLYPVFRHILPISRDGCYPIIVGMLSGFPIGAKCCADLVKTGKCTKKEGQFLLSFCNNASPMFILNYIYMQTIPVKHPFHFLCLIYLSSIAGGIISNIPFLKKEKYMSAPVVTHSTASSVNPAPPFFEQLDTVIIQSFEVLTKVGGYIILFSLLSNILLTYLPLSEKTGACLAVILEITSGMNSIGTSAFNIKEKLLLSASLTSFGGLSALAQTNSVLFQSGLSIRPYLSAKILSSTICLFLTYVYLTFIL